MTGGLTTACISQNIFKDLLKINEYINELRNNNNNDETIISPIF